MNSRSPKVAGASSSRKTPTSPSAGKRHAGQTASAKPRLTPKLRFPEFRDAPGWEAKTLGELFSQREEAGYTDLRLLSVTDKQGVIPQEDSNRRISASVDRSKYLRVVPGDIAYNTMRMWEGRSALARLEGIVSPAYTVCSPSGKTDGLFFSYYFKTAQLIEQFARYSQGLVKDTLNLKYESFARILVLTPRTPEQQKIAACLSSLDDLIAAESQKLDTVKTHKKGLMQQLFPREGETRPRLRFPEFQDAGEWEIKTLANACTMRAGQFVRASQIKEQPANGYFPCFGGNGLRGYTSTYTHEGVYPLVGRQGALCGNVKLCTGIFHATEHAVVARPKKGCDVVWLYYALDLLNLNRFATGQAQPGLSVDVLEKVVLAIPGQECEQHRIATCLSSLDDLIAAQADKLAALKAHKKGLMQQLFPVPEEAGA